jgi:hypothetical protein
MSGGPTIVVKFGDDVSSNALFVVELDEEMNRDGQGEVKSQFYPGDQVWLLMHYDSNLVIKDVRTTSGDIVRQGTVTRSHTEETLFADADTPVELPHNPYGGLGASWFGRSSALSVSGRQVTAESTPCIGNVTHSFLAELWMYTPPPLSLVADQEYPAAIVVYVENRQ